MNSFYRIINFLTGVMLLIVFTSIILSMLAKLENVKLTKLNKEMRINNSELNSLKAQWNYLNNREYIEQMAKKYLPKLNKNIKPVNNLNGLP